MLGLVDVEGNFTLADAFWSAELARKPAAEAEALLESYRADPAPAPSYRSPSPNGTAS